MMDNLARVSCWSCGESMAVTASEKAYDLHCRCGVVLTVGGGGAVGMKVSFSENGRCLLCNRALEDHDWLRGGSIRCWKGRG